MSAEEPKIKDETVNDLNQTIVPEHVQGRSWLMPWGPTVKPMPREAVSTEQESNR